MTTLKTELSSVNVLFYLVSQFLLLFVRPIHLQPVTDDNQNHFQNIHRTTTLPNIILCSL